MVSAEAGGDLVRQRGAIGRARSGAADKPRQERAGQGGRAAQLSAPIACSSVSSRAPERTNSSAGRVWFGI